MLKKIWISAVFRAIKNINIKKRHSLVIVEERLPYFIYLSTHTQWQQQQQQNHNLPSF